jgi:DNA-binding NarL/FixJ family response regulator
VSGIAGRGAELAEIEVVLDAVAGGERKLLVLRGEAGIGKTRLLDVVREGAVERRLNVLYGRATELEGDVPLAPVVDALEPAVRTLPAPALRDLGADQLRRLADVLPGIEDESADRWTPAVPAERWRLHRALGELLDVLGRRAPVALVLDDVHWADPVTLELLDHLLRRPPTRPHLIVLALRPGPVAERLAAARRSTGAGLELEIAPLERADAETLLGEIADPDARERLFRESGGNPLLLQELARAGSDGGPPGGIVEAIGEELRGLDGSARALLDAAAIVGDPFEVDLAAAVAGIERVDALAALDALVDRALVRSTDDARRFAFRHPVVRSAVYAGIPAGARLAGHEAAARELDGAPLPVRAHHLAHAAARGDIEAATTLRAAAAMVRPQAPAIAAEWLLAARRADPELGAEGLSTLAEALVEAGRLQEALAVVDEAVAGVDAARADAAASQDVGAADDEARIRLAIAGASVERQLGEHVAARARLEAALARHSADARLAARLRASLALAAYQRGDYEGMLRWAEEAANAPEAEASARAAGATMLALGLSIAGDEAAAAEAVETALAAFDEVTDEELVSAAELLTAVPWGLTGVERLHDALATAQRAATAVRAGGNGAVAVVFDTAAMLALAQLGRTREAIAAADLTDQAARVTGNDQTVQWVLWMRGWILLEHGDAAAAMTAAEESVALAERLEASWMVTVAGAVLGWALVEHGRCAEGRPLIAAYDSEPGWICRWAPPLVEASIGLGDLDTAATHAERAATYANALPLAGARAAAGRAGALVALARGDAARAAELALAAAADAERIDSMLDVARSRLLAGRALGGSDREAAIRELEAAERLAADAGVTRVADEAVRELRRLGRRVGRGGKRAAGDEGVAGLSTREREVAELVAEGLTNREIAARLFLSEKTIETHLSHTFGKLGVRSRAQVAAAIAAAAD